MTMPLALGAADVAERIGVDPSTVYRQMKVGEIPSVRIGGRRLIPTWWLRDTFRYEEPAEPDLEIVSSGDFS